MSILASTYNVECYLPELLDSLASQDLDGVEIVFVDDCSADGSMALLMKFQALHAHCTTVIQHAKNQGVSSARNTLLNAAKGHFVWFMDSDDALMPGAVTELKAIVDREDPDLVLCDYRKLRVKMGLKHRMRGELHCRTFAGVALQKITDRSSLVRGLFALGQMHVWSKISRRSIWGEDLRFPEGKYFEDMYMSPRLAIRAQSYYYAPRVWVAYRQRDGSIMSTPNARKSLDRSEALCGFVEEFHRIDPNPDSAAGFFISYTAARNFIAAAKSVSTASSPEGREKLKRYQSNFMRSIAMTLQDLRCAYFRRGWIWRWLRLAFWLRQVDRAGI